VDADEVESRSDGAGPFFVDREAELVERAGEADPGLVVRAKASREYDRTEAAQVHLLRRFAVERFRLGDLRRRQAAFGDQLPDQVHELPIPLIAPGDALAEVRCEAGVPALSAQEVAEHGDAHLPQRPVVEVVAAAGPRRLHVGGQPSGGARQRAEGRVEEPRLERPPSAASTGIASRHLSVASSGEDQAGWEACSGPLHQR
jgi:hypothetical protein